MKANKAAAQNRDILDSSDDDLEVSESANRRDNNNYGATVFGVAQPQMIQHQQNNFMMQQSHVPLNPLLTQNNAPTFFGQES